MRDDRKGSKSASPICRSSRLGPLLGLGSGWCPRRKTSPFHKHCSPAPRLLYSYCRYFYLVWSTQAGPLSWEPRAPAWATSMATLARMRPRRSWSRKTRAMAVPTTSRRWSGYTGSARDVASGDHCSRRQKTRHENHPWSVSIVASPTPSDRKQPSGPSTLSARPSAPTSASPRR